MAQPRPKRIAFGSCNDQDSQNSFWPIIESRRPAAFIWGGDAIYADYKSAIDWSTFPPSTELICGTPTRLRELYKRQLSQPGYMQLLESNVSIFGTFDDHDYGCNNADRTFPHRLESAVEYVKFIGEPAESAMARRAQAGRGAYGVKIFDFSRPAGQEEVHESEARVDPDAAASARFPNFIAPFTPTYSNATVAVFVLDVRTHKTPWKTGSAAYRPDYQGDFLGERQWEWFEAAIKRSQASVNVVVSGLQFHANKFPDGNIAEAWGKYPRAQQRLFDAILQDGVQSPILISGDVHMSQLSQKECVRNTPNIDRESPRPLVEMTTSGLTHSWGTISNPPASGPTPKPSWKVLYESQVARLMMHSLHRLSTWTDLLHVDPRRHKRRSEPSLTDGLQYSLEKNFGELEFDWEERTVALRTWGEDPTALPILAVKYSMDELSGLTASSYLQLNASDFREAAQLDQPFVEREWVCVNHRGQENHLFQMAGHVATGFALLILAPFPFLVPCFVFLLVWRRFAILRKSNISI